MRRHIFRRALSSKPIPIQMPEAIVLPATTDPRQLTASKRASRATNGRWTLASSKSCRSEKESAELLTVSERSLGFNSMRKTAFPRSACYYCQRMDPNATSLSSVSVHGTLWSARLLPKLVLQFFSVQSNHEASHVSRMLPV
jgi:hypothetical protein